MNSSNDSSNFEKGPHAAEANVGTRVDRRLNPSLCTDTGSNAAAPEKLSTLTVAATALGLPIFKLRRAAKAGAFPVYRVGNGRALVRLSEVIAAVEQSRDGGTQ